MTDTVFRVAGRCLAMVAIMVATYLLAAFAVHALGLDPRPTYATKGGVDVIGLFAIFPSVRRAIWS
jgi:hypothetical protein